EADAEQVGRIVLTQFLGLDGPPDQAEQQVVAEGRAEDGLAGEFARFEHAGVEAMGEGFALEDADAFARAIVGAAVFIVVEVRSEAVPRLCEPGVGRRRAVVVLHPRVKALPIVGGRYEAAKARAEPVTGIGPLATGEDSASIF